MIEEPNHVNLMDLALEQAHLAAAQSEVPIGAVVYHSPSESVIGVGHNTREADNNPIGHAEIQAITAAATHLQSWRLTDCTLYVTLEPCLMCAGAIFQARIENLVFGALDPKAGVFGSLYDFSKEHRFNHSIDVVGGVGTETSSQLLKSFFQDLRSNKRRTE